MKKKDKTFESDVSASTPDYSPERDKIVEEHAKMGGDPSARITEPVREASVGRGVGRELTGAEDTLKRAQASNKKEELPIGPVGDEMPGTAANIINMDDKIKSEETALPKDKANPDLAHNTLHTAGGEMPNMNKKSVGKEPLTDEDSKKAG